MINFKFCNDAKFSSRTWLLIVTATAGLVFGGQGAGATEDIFIPGNGGGSSGGNQQQQSQSQNQVKNQIQDQNQTQQQGDNQVNVDGDDNDYFALALPNLVAASCAGQSYSVGAGGAGFGFGLGQALIDENCQIAKAIATAHLLNRAGLVRLGPKEYRRALCQMRGMEHVCEGGSKKRHFPAWCKHRIIHDTKASRWSERDLHACGLSREKFDTDRIAWSDNPAYQNKVIITDRKKPPMKGMKHGHDDSSWRQHGMDPELGDEKHGHGDWHHRHKLSKKKHQVSYKSKHVAVRVGEHDDYDRIVFDWPYAVGYKVKRWNDGDT